MSQQKSELTFFGELCSFLIKWTVLPFFLYTYYYIVASYH